MLIGASMAAFPDAFPGWLQILAIGIAIITIGVGLTLVWTDLSKFASVVGLRPSWIGPIISLVGLAIILSLGLWYFYQAPKDAFSGSSVGIVLVAAILVVSFVFLTGRLGLPPPIVADQTGSEALVQSAPTASFKAGDGAIPSQIETEKTANPQANRDLLILLNYAVYQSTVLMLDDLLRSAPEGISAGPLELGGDFATKNEDSKGFIALVRRKLDPGSHRRSNFESEMFHAEKEAETQVEQTPPEQRPAGIDHLALRRYAIAHLQCAKAIVFLQNEKREAEENLLSQRSNLLKQYTLRNPG